MFFKMLKNDLRQKKALNFVLFLFITIAAMLVFVSSVQLHEYITGNERNRDACKMSDMLIFSDSQGSTQEDLRKNCKDNLDKNSHVKSYYQREMKRAQIGQIDFEMVDEKSINDLQYSNHYLTVLPKDRDLLYSIDDSPISVENNTVWLPQSYRTLAGVNVGDIMKLTTDMGNTYPLRVAGFFKQPYLGYFKWYVISDADYEYLYGEFFGTTDMYGLQLHEVSYSVYMDLSDKLSKVSSIEIEMQDMQNSNEYILSFILSVFLALICLFFILIIIMTIRFTMIAALKDEECEIGMMRAIGVDSFAFRWLFAAKYIAFALAGGAIGIAAGYPLSRYVLSVFSADSIFPSAEEIIIAGIASVILIILLIVGFSFIVMRRINRISVISAIRGENIGERFGRSKTVLLHRSRIMPTPFYLAVSDIIKCFKRYVFLLIAYTLGILVILFAFNIKNSVISTDFLKYYLQYQIDFFIEFNRDQLSEYNSRMMAEDKDLWELVNEDIKKAGIPAHVDADHYNTSGITKLNKNDILTNVYYGKGDISRFPYCAGTMPVKKNEAALSRYSASNLGIGIGDEIEIILGTTSENGMSRESTSEKFKVTGLIDMVDSGTLTAVLSNEYEPEGSQKDYPCGMALIIDAEGQEKEKVFNDLAKLFGEEETITGDEYVHRSMLEYYQLFTMLEYGVGGLVIFILILMTYLYSSIFIAEEKSEIAFLKSLGFTDGSIKAAHVIRILLLAIAAVILGELLLQTAGQAIVGMIMESLGITGFRFLPEWVFSVCVIPCILTAAVVLTQWLNLGQIKKIAIWSISNE